MEIEPVHTSKKKTALTIEFVGLPGAGKTTSSRCFARQLRQKGFKVVILQDIKDYIRKMGFGRKLLLVLKAMLFRTHTLLSYTAALAKNNIYSANSIYRFIRLTLFDLALEQLKKEKGADVILLEQWMIQELWSATIFKLKPSNKLEEKLQQFYFKTDFVLYLDVDVATAAQRINKRETGLSRFDRMDPDKRVEELMRYGTYLYQLFEKSDCRQKHLYSATVAPEVNAVSFVRKLEEQFSKS